jgi:uncharacterized membrane protein
MNIRASALATGGALVRLFDEPKYRTMIFWQKIYIIFCGMSIFGHYLEVFLANVKPIMSAGPVILPTMPTILPIAAPYGFGAVGVLLVTVPLIRKYRLNPIGVFGLSVIVSAIVEYTSAALIVAFAGRNAFWDYSNQPFNLNGYIYLEGVLFFGFIAMLFVYYVYPSIEKYMNMLKNRQIKIAFWLMFVGYGADLAYLALK